MKKKINSLLSVVTRIASRNWCPATGGNFSVRLSPERFFVTRSGEDKSNLTEKSLLECVVENAASLTGEIPSAETPIHAALYAMNPEIGAVLHTHTVAATVMSKMHLSKGSISLTGYEMIKSIRGHSSHLDSLKLPIIENTQDIAALGTEIRKNPAKLQDAFGFILSAHGLYAWGSTPQEALRHVEGFEFLLECLLAESSISL